MNKKTLTGELSRHRDWVVYLLILLAVGGGVVGYILLGSYGLEAAIVVLSVVMLFFFIGEYAYVAFTADEECVMFTEPKGKTTTVMFRNISDLNTHNWTSSHKGHKILHVYVRFCAGGKRYKFYSIKHFDPREVKHDNLRYNRMVNETDAKRLFDHIMEMNNSGYYQR